ncbi:hypothetical protein DFH09DRAFT_1113895 [Mycena vulgaris]|nr:hypothetical protein DFH09DRAFT_1113895 [Mycena vulgaris]
MVWKNVDAILENIFTHFGFQAGQTLAALAEATQQYDTDGISFLNHQKEALNVEVVSSGHVNEIIAHRWSSARSLKFHVRWTAGDYTWEPPKALEDCAALDQYFEAMGQSGGDRYRSRLPQSYASTTSGHRSPEYDNGYGRDRSPLYGERRRSRSRPQYRDESPPRPSQYWSPRCRSPSPPQASQSRFDGPRRYQEERWDDKRRATPGFRGRGHAPQRDDRVHIRAPESRPADGWIRTVYPPAIKLALRDSGSHPLFPDSVSNDDESEYDSEDDVKEPTNYSTNEGIQRNRAIMAEKVGRLYGKVFEESDPQRVGVWTGAGTVLTFVQARNMLRWIHHGDRSMMEFLKHIMTQRCRALSANDRVQRSKPANAGRPGPPGFPFQAPIVVASVGTPEAILQLPNMLAPQQAPPASTEPVATQDADEDMPDAPGVKPPVLRAYLGSSPAPNEGAPGVVLTENDDAEHDTHRPIFASREKMVRWYGNVPTSHWPKGMRISSNALPDTPNASPWVPDVTSWCTLNALSPVRVPGGSSLDRARFLDAAIRMLSVHGTYLRYTEEGGYIFNNLPLEQYPFDATNISFAQITAWFIQHGIARNSDDLATLESYARSCRNHIAGNEDLNTHEFDAGHPAICLDVENIIIHDEDCWDRVRHATVRIDISMNYPQFPVGVNGGLAASMHTPEGPGGSRGTDT